MTSLGLLPLISLGMRSSGAVGNRIELVGKEVSFAYPGLPSATSKLQSMSVTAGDYLRENQGDTFVVYTDPCCNI